MANPVTVLGTLPFLTQDVGGADLHGLFMFLRIARAPAQYVLSRASTRVGIRPARQHISVGGFVARRLVRE